MTRMMKHRAKQSHLTGMARDTVLRTLAATSHSALRTTVSRASGNIPLKSIV